MADRCAVAVSCARKCAIIGKSAQFSFVKIDNFVRKKMTIYEKPPTEADLLEWLRTLESGFPPVSIKVVSLEPLFDKLRVDALVDVKWRKEKYRFVVEFKSLSTPMAIETAIDQAKKISKELKFYPLIVTPYLSDEQLQRLERDEASGLDMSGNGILQVPGKLMVFRSGARNRFPRGAPIQNIYRGNSSLVARTFLIKPEYGSAQELLAEIVVRGGKVTLSTISKACSTLAEDLIITRERKERTTPLRLLQREKLLDALASNFSPVKYRKAYSGKYSFDRRQLTAALLKWSKQENQRVARTGSDSVERYATMAREPIMKFYCTNMASLIRRLGNDVSETSRFNNVEFLETLDPTAYYDMRDDLAASPIQCYLELQAGDKREKETAGQVRRRLLEDAEGEKGTK